MDIDRRVSRHLTIALVILLLSIAWLALSYYLESTCSKGNGWFAKSGAILVLGSLWSALLTRPTIEDAEVPDYLNSYNNIVRDEPLKKEHWTVKYSMSNKLVYAELLLGTVGTLVWAYGDTWLPRCATCV